MTFFSFRRVGQPSECGSTRGLARAWKASKLAGDRERRRCVPTQSSQSPGFHCCRKNESVVTVRLLVCHQRGAFKACARTCVCWMAWPLIGPLQARSCTAPAVRLSLLRPCPPSRGRGTGSCWGCFLRPGYRPDQQRRQRDRGGWKPSDSVARRRTDWDVCNGESLLVWWWVGVHQLRRSLSRSLRGEAG